VIITRSPLRISLGGGGHGPAVLLPGAWRVCDLRGDQPVRLHHAAPDVFRPGLIVKYSKMEHGGKRVVDLKHPIVREALRMVLGDSMLSYLEMTSMSDIPAGTGLGSSGSFTTALLTALHTMHIRRWWGGRTWRSRLATLRSTGWASRSGSRTSTLPPMAGCSACTSGRMGRVRVEPLAASAETLYTLEDNLVLFFTGYTRSASAILQEQDTKSKQKDTGMAQNLHFIKELGVESRKAFESGDVRRFGEIMHTHWEHKKKRSSGDEQPAD
jgi:D-glycero-alpha-D-manno-heptose-7-phosphate kinase